MVDKISITSIKKSGGSTFSLDIDIPSEEVVPEPIEEPSQEELVEETSVNEEPEVETYVMNIDSVEESEDVQPKRIILPTESIDIYANGIEEVIENSLVGGTDNIYITEKKYILPIENLDNATYVDNLKGG